MSNPKGETMAIDEPAGKSGEKESKRPVKEKNIPKRGDKIGIFSPSIDSINICCFNYVIRVLHSLPYNRTTHYRSYPVFYQLNSRHYFF